MKYMKITHIKLHTTEYTHNTRLIEVELKSSPTERSTFIEISVDNS